MKRTLSRFKISNRLDLPNDEPPPVIADPELAAFANTLIELDQRLRTSRVPAAEPPPWLHASIMNEVRQQAAESATTTRRHVSRPAWAWGVASAILTVMVLMLVNSMQSGSRSLLNATHADADEMIRRAASQSAGALTAPFDTELDNLSKDLDRAAAFLIASLR